MTPLRRLQSGTDQRLGAVPVFRPRLRILSLALPLSLIAGAAGCGFGAPASGIVTGLVTYDGRPAAGKRVTLAGGAAKVAATDASGRYTFNAVAAGKWQIQYKGEGDREGAIPNEVAAWRSLTFDMVDGSGKEVPGIEVAYNGLLYPEAGMALVVSAEAVVPFHWSTHPRAQRYRVTLDKDAGAGRLWQSQWVGEPTAVFGQTVSPGRYWWSVEIDGGESGTGTTRSRQVDF